MIWCYFTKILPTQENTFITFRIRQAILSQLQHTFPPHKSNKSPNRIYLNKKQSEGRTTYKENFDTYIWTNISYFILYVLLLFFSWVYYFLPVIEFGPVNNAHRNHQWPLPVDVFLHIVSHFSSPFTCEIRTQPYFTN